MTDRLGVSTPPPAAKGSQLQSCFGPEVVLLTGFPGRAAESLLWLLLERELEAEFWLIVSPEQRALADSLLAERAAFAGRVRVIPGEPCAIDLGLSRTAYAELAKCADRWLALYRTTDPRTSRELSQRVNLGAARELAEFCKVSSKLAQVTYFSSAVVFGDHRGAAAEQDLGLGQRFRSPVEESLALAEALLRRHLAEVPLSVVRTPQLLGSRKGGRTPDAAGLYLLLALVASAPKDAILPLPPGSDRLVRALPVDFVAEALYAVSVLGTRGHVYHFADPDPPPLSRVMEQAAAFFGKSLEQGFDARALARLVLRSPGFWLAQQSSRGMTEWAEGSSELLTRAGDRLLERAGLIAPSLLSYLPQVLQDAELLSKKERSERTSARTPSEAIS